MAAWGNALGGYRLQRRDRKGRFSHGGNSVTRNFRKAHSKLLRSGPQRPLHYVYKDKNTGRSEEMVVGTKLANKRVVRSGGGFVPYARKGLGHTTVGINAGATLPKKAQPKDLWKPGGTNHPRRVSAGFYFRVEGGRSGSKALKISKEQERLQKQVARQMSVGPGSLLGKKNESGIRTLGGNLKRVKRAQSRFVMDKIGRERRSSKNTWTRVGTDRNSLPVVVVRANSAKDRYNRNRIKETKRKKAVAAYNASSNVTKRSYKWTQPTSSRPQRRNAAGKKLNK